jgi:hypothetical protein
VREFRILYDVDGGADEVVLLIIARKVGNTLFVSGEEFHEHQGDPAKPSGGGSEGDTA